MKTLKMNIMSLSWILAFALMTLSGSSQETKLTRQEKKEIRQAQLAINFNILDSLLNAKSFVLEADYLQDRYGVRIPVLSNLNFIRVTGDNGVLQTGSAVGMGYNNVGGVTAEGSVGSWKVFRNDKRMTYILQFDLLTNIGHYDVNMQVGADNHATATITGLGPGKLTWEGHLETPGNSRIFKGMNTI